jgi:hypothetical protein
MEGDPGRAGRGGDQTAAEVAVGLAPVFQTLSILLRNTPWASRRPRDLIGVAGPIKPDGLLS